MSESGMPSRAGWPLRRFLALFLLIVFPLLVFGIHGIVQLRNAREAEARQEASRLLGLVEAEQERIIDDVHHILAALVEMGAGRMPAPECQDTMARLRARYPSYLSIHLSDKAGTVWCSTEPAALGKSVADRPYRNEALRTGEVATGVFMLARTNGRPSIPFALAYTDPGGERAGVVTVLLDVGWLEQYVVQKPLPENAAVLFADRNGTVIARVPDLPNLSGQPLPERFHPLLHATAKGVVDHQGLDGAQRITAFSPPQAGVPNLYIHVSLDRATAERPVNEATLRTSALFVGLLLLAALGALWGFRRFVRVREQAEQSALRTATVLASTVDGVIEFDRDWRFTYLNQRASELLGRDADLLGKRLWDVFPELRHDPMQAKAQEAMERRVAMEAEFLGPRTQRWYWMRAFPSDDGVTLYLLDISRRRKAEEELRQSKDHLSLALASAKAGTFDWDVPAGRGQWSEESCRILGLDPAENDPTAETWMRIVHPDDLIPCCLAEWERLIAGRRPDARFEYRVVLPSGGIRWVTSIGRIRYDKDGRPVRFSGILLDISRSKSMEEALREAKAKADEANLSKSKFLAAASHDLRQPLQSALLFAGVLHGHVTDAKGRGPLASLERALDTLKSLLDSLLDASRLDAGVIVPQVADFTLGPLLDEINASYAPIAASKGLAFEVDQSAAPLAVHSDRLLLGRMLRNLVENAIRYTEKGGIRVSCEPTADSLAIRVTDSGIGISAEQLGKIFEEFHQVANPERDRSQGLGLGLAIVQRLSRLLNHPVLVTSEPGRGSVFSIEVPRAVGQAVPQPPAAPEPEPVASGGGQGRMAVLVDDDVIVLTGLLDTFREWGFDVVVAGSAEQALERLRSAPRSPDIIVADYRLRDRQVGTDAIARIRDQVGRSVPGIVLTGEIGGECERAAAALGVAVVHKPITPRLLHRAVQTLLDTADRRDGVPSR